MKIIGLIPLLLVVVLIGPGPARTEPPPNIILISVDTLRADRLGCYGYHHDTSPHLDRMVKRGTLFMDAMANIPLTNPGFASMFTSRYPHEIGAIRNGIPMVDGIPTLAMILKEHGYHTAAILSNWPLKRHLSNLQQGFDLYEDDFTEKRWLIFKSERDASGVTGLTLEWLNNAPDQPFFLWVHYSDPHAPYRAHSQFRFDRPTTDSARYDSEVGYTDHHLGKVLKKMESMGLFERSLVIFLSDHGESLGEHNYTGHGRNVYQPGMQVPFAVIGPGLPANRRESATVELLDLTPTILGYLGIPIPPEMRGRNLIPMIKGEDPYPDTTIFYETFPGAAPQVPGAEKMLKRPIYVGLRTGSTKVMFNVRYQRWEKYDLARDPGELDNLGNPRDQDFQKLSDQLQAWYESWADQTVIGEIGVMDEEDHKRFRDMGYFSDSE